MVEIPVVEGEGWVAKIYRCRHVTRIKGDLSPLLNLSQDPGTPSSASLSGTKVMRLES